ncbi:MAG: EAL domain-containing protein [Clostridia bacterium]|nr:EAL domain-containing protein [Clostridia bacterium]
MLNPPLMHSPNRRRKILVVEDERINRELLGMILSDTYDVLNAEDAKSAFRILWENQKVISLILLDLNLPDAHGLDILRQVKADPSTARIPVIVITSDREAEVESLTAGAIDFIPKPYPMPAVIQARVLRTIELSEDRDIIRYTECDSLTGLYNRDYFYSYAEQLDTFHKDTSMDAIVVDVNHFHMVNERFGKAYGDEVLRTIARQLQEIVKDNSGIVCRREDDTFLLYCPHRTDYSDILEKISAGLESRIRLRMGVYADVDKTIDVEQRFDRAKMAADTVRNSFSKVVAIYDNALHESELFAEQLLEDFPKALAEKQFVIYYQPKFDIRPSVPILSSAEALIRWNHPQLGMISPGVFIPLFESNGLIQKLDHYVWEETAAQMRDWKDRLGISVPVSVNVSRVDMFDSDLTGNMQQLVSRYGLTPGELLLEITESAYTQNSDQIISTVNKLRNAGFHIEMDDFGSGYSSLNMLSNLPVDAIKLDMQFIRSAFKGRKNTKMLEVVIEIAGSLNVPTIAEGVETAEQMLTLKTMGCDIVQGYYFSRPLPPADYEAFLLARKSAVEEIVEKKPRVKMWDFAEKFTYDALHDPQTGLYNYSAYEMLLRDADQNHIALMVINVDDFEALRATGGYGTGDRVIERVADVLRMHFRSVDYICRISNDEFVVIVTRVNSTVQQLLVEKVNQMNQALQNPADGIPAVTISAGVAFADREHPQGDIFHDADTALIHLRETGRYGCAVFDSGSTAATAKQLSL